MSLAHYLLQANIYLIVFYGFYRLLLDRETYFLLNRVYLISAACFSLLIPFIRLDWFSTQPVTQNVSVSVSQLYMVAGINDNPASAFNLGNTIALLYVVGVCLFLLRLCIQLLSIRKLTRSIPEGTAFSFFNKLFIHPKLPQQQVISKHEQIHMRQMHSLDVIFFEFLAVFSWFNPVVYFYKQSIKNIHEYLADEEAARFQGDKQQYALLLLSTAFGVNPNTLTNSFFNKSMIKKRITMLHKQKSRKTAILKYGLFVPLFGLTLILSSATIRKNESIRVAAENIPLDQPLKVVSDALPTIQSKSVDSGAKAKQDRTPYKQEKVFDFTSVDTPPMFPGGMSKFYSYLGKSIRYPQEAIKNNVQGSVFLAFIVEKDGRLSHIEVQKRLGSGTDEEAVRVLESSPRWTPAVKDKQVVRVMYHMPISFTLSNSKTGEPSQIAAATVYIIDNKEATAEEAHKLDPVTIESMNVIKASDGKKAGSKIVKSDVIIIKTKAVKSDTTKAKPIGE